ncbi:hypothetical protein [Polyangium aurulentum]|uniref:hypothetical protein n=1 Tax=Polyangium aurulentum TaxID=2567896 RepID=UPI00146AA16C|nr:hypothetical protein [Polyangium aurulentum]UQA57644.1 hypothetical protein E8A73_041250 [Polyangium aurulentum]
MGFTERRGRHPETPFRRLENPKKKPLQLFAFGNVAVGFIAVGNVAVGVVAVGLSVAVGPIAIGINSLGVLLALGVNGAATITLAAVNGLGLVSFTGVNSIGTFAAGFVNTFESVLVAPVLLVFQLVLAFALRGGSREPDAPALPPTARLADLVSGAAESGPVRARIRHSGPQEIRVADDDDNDTFASLALAGPAHADLAELPSRAVDGYAPVLVEVRAATDLLPPSSSDDYRSAPQKSRKLWAERVLAIPEPPPFWEHPDTLRNVTRLSLVIGAVTSAIGLATRIALG